MSNQYITLTLANIGNIKAIPQVNVTETAHTYLLQLYILILFLISVHVWQKFNKSLQLPLII